MRIRRADATTVLGLFKARCAEYGLKEKPYEGTDNFTLTKQERARRPRKSAVHDKGASDAAGKDQPKEQAKEAQETQKQAPASGQAGEKEAGVSTARGASPPPSSSTARAPETPPKGGSPSRTVVINATPSNRTPTPGRPEHSAMVARRLIAGSLGLKVEASPEVKERERQQLEREKARREALRAEQASSK